MLIVAVLATITIANAQTGWISYKGDNRISVKFPAQPKELSPGSVMAQSSDSVVYVFTIVDFVQVANLDSAAIAPMKDSPEFAAQLKVGMKSSLPDVDFSDFKIGKWKGFTSYTSSGLDSKKKKYDFFMFIIGSKLYSTSTISMDGKGTKNKEDYFNSITVTN